MMKSINERRWVDVVFPHPPWRRFTYRVPDVFLTELDIGHRVTVLLGRRRTTGFVVAFVSRPEIRNLRDIEDVIDPYPLLTPELLNLSRWVADYYMANWGEVIRAALPPGILQRSQWVVHSVQDADTSGTSLSNIQQKILRCVEENGKMPLRNLEKKLKERNIRYILGSMERMGLIWNEYILEDPRIRVKSEVWVSLRDAFDPADIQTLKKRAPRQAYAMERLLSLGGEARRSDVDVDFSVLRKMEVNGWIEMWEEEIYREPHQETKPSPPAKVNLTDEQSQALLQITRQLKKGEFHTFLLHGVTASGKTQVYIESIRRVLDRGKTALVLIPEIALTPQAVQRYRACFGEGVAVLHSRMSPGERYDSWRKIREGKCRICLGPRSAIFAPLERLGLIVVDEEQEASYKQMDPAPRYHARDVAVVRGKQNDCVVILGSATPSIESYFNALNGKYTLCRLTHRIDRVPLPRVTLVNQNETKDKKERRARAIFSSLLTDKIRKRLSDGEQVILLQNRRGYAMFLRCRECGGIEECPHCDITLTYHQRDHRLRCHYCGFQKTAYDSCPKCGGVTLQYQGVGTQRVEEEIKRLFPETHLLRMDQDTTRRKGAHDRIVHAFEEGRGDVLLGTQMVAKGHDFPGVNLVGIVSADTGLHFPDFRSGERTFQLMTQAAGRAGRRDVRGEVVVQTHAPENPILQFIVEQDYEKYYRWEIEQRKELGYPPWGRIVVVRFKGADERSVMQAASAFRKQIKPSPLFECLGPASAPLSRIKGMYRYQILFRQKKESDPSGMEFRNVIRKAIVNYVKRSHLPDVRLGVDVDPVDLL